MGDRRRSEQPDQQYDLQEIASSEAAGKEYAATSREAQDKLDALQSSKVLDPETLKQLVKA